MEDRFNQDPENKSSNDAVNKSKEAWDKGKEKIKSLSDSVQSSLHTEGNERFYAAFSYVPFIGPMICWAFKKHQPLTLSNLKNAAYLQLALMGVYLIVLLLEKLPIVSTILKTAQFVPIVTDAANYLSGLVFIFLSVFAATQAFQGKTYKIPFLSDLGNKYVNIFDTPDNRQD